MTPGKLSYQMNRKYLCWNFDTYTSRDQAIPVLKYYFLTGQDGKQQIKLEYYQDLGCTQSDYISSEYLDAELSDEKILSLIDERMTSDKWFEIPKCFTKEKLSFLDFPVGFCDITAWIEGIRIPFSVESAGYGAAYHDSAGRCVSTQTVFDICVPTKWLEVGVWYALSFVSNQASKASWHGFPNRYTSPMSLVLTGILENWAFGIGAYNGRSDPQLCDSYEVRYAPDGNGFLFRMKQEGIKRIWFKAAWLKSEGQDERLCQQALRHWLE